MLSVVRLNVGMLCVVRLNVGMLSVVRLSVVAPWCRHFVVMRDLNI